MQKAKSINFPVNPICAMDEEIYEVRQNGMNFIPKFLLKHDRD